MEITFKNTSGTTKGKQCEQFLSLFKKFKFLLPSKDRRMSFYVDKQSKKFIITTFSERSLENPPAGCPSYFIDYEFAEDMYNLSQFAGNKPYVFCFDIDDAVKLITHNYQTKMSVLKIFVNSDIQKGTIQFQVPDQTEGLIPLTVQKLSRFPAKKSYQDKDYVDYVTLFQLTQQNFDQLKQVQDFNLNCCYQIHEQGIYLKHYDSKIQGNNFLIKKDYLPKFDPCTLKQKLRGNVYLQETNNFLIKELIDAAKKHYKKVNVNLIITRHPEQRQIIRLVYIEIQCQLILFPKSIKRIICNCDISEEINPEGMKKISTEDVQTMDLLKSEEPGIEGLRKIVLNRWSVPRASQYMEERVVAEIYHQGPGYVRDEFVEETKTRKMFYKIQEQD